MISQQSSIWVDTQSCWKESESFIGSTSSWIGGEGGVFTIGDIDWINLNEIQFISSKVFFVE